MSSSNAGLSGTRQMNQAAKAQEPSMEEILASIRRIIADDDAAKSPPPEPPKPPPVAVVTPRPAPQAPEPAFVPMPASETMLDEMLAELNATPAPLEEPAEDLGSDVLDLTEAMAADPVAGFRTIDGQSDIVF